jgi:lipopolysaccharide export system protein LptA
MTINTKTNDVKMESNAKGRGKPNRVRAVLYPKQTTRRLARRATTPATPAQAARRPSAERP